jgi:hypothetical protein
MQLDPGIPSAFGAAQPFPIDQLGPCLVERTGVLFVQLQCPLIVLLGVGVGRG